MNKIERITISIQVKLMKFIIFSKLPPDVKSNNANDWVKSPRNG